MNRIRQIQLNRKAGMTFASGLRAIMRQDPDVIMVGETRDKETAGISVQAALTGHRVLSSVHTNDAAGAITRLLDMEIEPFLVSSVMLLSIAQRLVRKVCSHCAKPHTPSPSALSYWGFGEKDGGKFLKGSGCIHCMDKGYKGRTGIFEVLIIDETVQRMIHERRSAQEITGAIHAKGKLTTLKEDAATKVLAGITTLEEATSVGYGLKGAGMAEFAYKAFNKEGSPITGMIEADTPGVALKNLSSHGYIPIKVTEKRNFSSQSNIISLFKRVGSAELIIFTRQFKTLIQAGIPILTIFKVLEDQCENRNLKAIITTLVQDIQEGLSLYEAFKKHPATFNPLYCNMLRAGEASGSLPKVLDRLIYLLEHEQTVTSEIKTAETYPIFVMVLLVIVMGVCLTFIIPKFASIFSWAGLTLPLITQFSLTAYQILSKYWILFFGGTTLVTLSLIFFWKTEKVRLIRDTLLLHIPLLGSLFIKASMTRFASIFSILQSSGVNILDTLKMLSSTINNAAIEKELNHIHQRLEQGRGIAEPLKSSRYFPPLVISMVAIGEESGKLEEMLTEVTHHYDKELAYAMRQLSSSIGPLLTIVLAGVIGFFALAVFLPMWDLTQMVK